MMIWTPHWLLPCNTGDEISGWHITVYTDEACTQKLRTLITGQDGTVGIYLEPGTYWVKETGSEEVRDDYWKMDDSVKKLVIRSHEKTTLEFINNYSGRISIQKIVKPESTLEGWKFKITDTDGKEVSGSPFATDKNGKILTGNLAPGDYTVEEVLPADSLYTGEAPKTVTVTACKTAEVSFLNKLRTGKITIRKVDTKDEPLAGATFLLEGSEDGSLWYPVIPGSKTTVIRQFGKEQYSCFVEINFITDTDATKIFTGNLDANTIMGSPSNIRR